MAEAGGVDLYRVLGVAPDASPREIRRAYRRLARQHHPDLNPHPDGARHFALLADAYETLHDPAQRARYDRRRPRPDRPPRVSPHQPEWQDSTHGLSTHGLLELSFEEAALLTRHDLRLRDARGQTIVVPAGTRHGDRLAVFHDGHRAVLIVSIPGKT